MHIFWGMLCIAIDIKIEDVDVLLPDVLGFILIAVALRTLGAEDAHFRQAMPFAIVGAVVSIPAMVPMEPIQPFAMLQTIFEVLVVWHICSGIMGLAQASGNATLAANSNSLRKWVAAMGAVYLGTAGLAQLSLDAVKVLIIPVGLCTLTIAVLTLVLIRRAAVET